MMRGGILLIFGQSQRLRSPLALFSVKHCGFDTDFSFCQITLKLHKYIVYDKRRLIRGNRIKGQGQPFKPLWTRYRLQIMSDHFETLYTCCQILG